ncbi:GNAT family N-acetyltransferase [Geopseudomonas aromaticivorans]
MSELRTLYHGTSATFGRFSLDFAVRPDMHGNGALGVWLGVDKTLAARFGDRCLVVEAGFERVYPMPIDELALLARDFGRLAGDMPDDEAAVAERAYYRAHRERLLAQGFDAIDVVEVSGETHMMIALDPEKLSIQGRLLYHVTPEANLYSISKQGLLPATGPRSADLGEQEPAVYCFPNREAVEDALGNWLGDRFDEDEPLAILELQVPVGSEAPAELPGAAFEVVVAERVPPEAVKAIYNEDWTTRFWPTAAPVPKHRCEIEIDTDDIEGRLSGFVVDAEHRDIEQYLEPRLGGEDCPDHEAVGELLRQRGGRVALLKSIRVIEDARGEGWGAWLMEQFIEQATAAGATDWLLVCDEEELQQPGFDLSAWYERYGFQTAFATDGDVGLLMAKGEGLVEALRQLHAEFECEQLAGYSLAPAM